MANIRFITLISLWIEGFRSFWQLDDLSSEFEFDISTKHYQYIALSVDYITQAFRIFDVTLIHVCRKYLYVISILKPFNSCIFSYFKRSSVVIWHYQQRRNPCGHYLQQVSFLLLFSFYTDHVHLDLVKPYPLRVYRLSVQVSYYVLLCLFCKKVVHFASSYRHSHNAIAHNSRLC